MQENKFPNGFITKRRDTAPEYVIANYSIKVDEFIQWLQENRDGDWVNLTTKKSKAGKLYTEIDTWKPQAKTEQDTSNSTREEVAADELNDEVPF